MASRDRTQGSARAPGARPRGALGCVGWLAAALAFGGCTDDPVEAGRAGAAEQVGVAEAGEGQLGRVHVIVQPQPDELEPEPQLQIQGRFVVYRGVSEALVRARANLPVPAWEQLVIGQCVASEALLPVEPGLGSGGGRDPGVRELSMIDAGDLRVTLGTRELVAPLSLVPDILPWLSGVEYGHVDDRLPDLPVEPDGTSPGLVSLDGSADGTLEPFSLPVVIPAQLQLEAARIAGEQLTIDWRPPGDTSEFVVLRLQAFTTSDGGNELVGDELTCLVADSGRADLALVPLLDAGLGLGAAELLRVSISRFDIHQVQAGSFGAVDVMVELRAQRTLDLR